MTVRKRREENVNFTRRKELRNTAKLDYREKKKKRKLILRKGKGLRKTLRLNCKEKKREKIIQLMHAR